MGSGSGNGPMVAYINGEGVVIGTPLPNITPDYSAGGVSAAEVTESPAAMTAAVSGMSITMGEAVGVTTERRRSCEAV